MGLGWSALKILSLGQWLFKIGLLSFVLLPALAPWFIRRSHENYV